MQEKNSTDVKKILLSLAEHLNVDRLRGLAKVLGVKEGTLYGWIKRGKIGNTSAILGKYPYISLDWLETGHGPMMYIDKKQSLPELKTQEEGLPMVRMYRELAKMDADTLLEIQTWLNEMEKMRPGFTGWFRLEFQNRFPEFDEWKQKILKNSATGTDN